MEEHDELYRPRTVLPSGVLIQRFGAVECAVIVTDTDPHSAQAQYLPDRSIAMVIADDVTAAQLASALPPLLAHAAAIADRPTQAAITLPRSDVHRCRVVREAGLPPIAMLAIADLRRSRGMPFDASIAVRDARPEDAQDLIRLYWDEAEYEARLGTLRLSPEIRASIAAEVPAIIAGPGRTLLAERDGRVVGAVIAQSPADSAWATARVDIEPVSYLAVASTSPTARGGGVGTALVAELHRRHVSGGIIASALHYSAYNPLSIPFWSRCGYRPLLTTYAAAVR